MRWGVLLGPCLDLSYLFGCLFVILQLTCNLMACPAVLGVLPIDVGLSSGLWISSGWLGLMFCVKSSVQVISFAFPIWRVAIQ